MTRASDAEREAVVARLRNAAGEGRLTVEELSERVELAYVARTEAELAKLSADLPAPVPGMPAVVPVADERSDWVVAVMSGADRKGRWRVRRHTSVVAVMGGVSVAGELLLPTAGLAGFAARTAFLAAIPVLLVFVRVVTVQQLARFGSSVRS